MRWPRSCGCDLLRVLCRWSSPGWWCSRALLRLLGLQVELQADLGMGRVCGPLEWEAALSCTDARTTGAGEAFTITL